MPVPVASTFNCSANDINKQNITLILAVLHDIFTNVVQPLRDAGHPLTVPLYMLSAKPISAL